MTSPHSSSASFRDIVASAGRDLAHAVRSLARARGFSIVCILSLGIGMGAVVGLVTFTRFVTAPARGIDANGLTEVLVMPTGPLRARAGVWATEQWSYPDLQALREADTGMAVAGVVRESSLLGIRTSDDESPARVTTLYVSPNYFRVLGVALDRGPGFDPALDDVPSAAPRVVVSDDFWRSRMAADPGAIGATVTLDGVAHTVVGITPPGFHDESHPVKAPAAPVFVPLEQHPRLRGAQGLRNDRRVEWVRVYGRLREGIDVEQADVLVSAVAARLAERYPATNEFKQASVQPYASLGAARWPQSRRAFLVISGMTGAVLLVVCLNISGMMLVRGARRERELSIRAALGAGRRRLAQHLFFEAVILAFAGGALSAVVIFGIPALIAWRLGVPVPPEIELDALAVVIATGLCLTVSVLFGLLPAMRYSRPDLTPGLKDDTGVGGRRTIRIHRVAAAVQVGIAIPFLVVSGVMLDRVRTAEFGFPTDGLAMVRLAAPPDGARERGSTLGRVRDSLREAGGIRAVALADGAPIDFDYRLFRVGRPDHAEFVTAQVTRVDEQFLATVGVPLLRGRNVTVDDRVTAAPVTVISTALAERLFPGAEPIGESLVVTREDQRDQEYTIVGVSGDFATSQLTTERPQLLLPLPEVLDAPASLIVRGSPGEELRLRAAIENALREQHVEAQPGVAFQGVVTGLELRDKSLADLVAESIAVAVAGSIVLLLASLGIVGVVAFMVATRQREIAVRMALGSTRFRVFRMMLRDTVRLVLPGVAGGLVLASILIRSIENVMGTPLTLGDRPLGTMEPVIYATAAAVAVATALLAGLPAARRATTIAPMAAMRAE